MAHYAWKPVENWIIDIQLKFWLSLAAILEAILGYLSNHVVTILNKFVDPQYIENGILHLKIGWKLNDIQQF